ncbi:MAG: type transport system permease protein [Frankiales bacterium]|nr:type transport system permease protein [Frankiales bacterium]
MTVTLEQPVETGSPGLWVAYQWELEKLSAQARTRLVAAICLLAPLLFAAGLQLSSTVPADTLFGRWVGDSGYAIPLVVLGFAGSWGFPLVVCLVAGDIFAAEDQYQTWTAILTRSVSRRDVFTGKVLAAMTYAVCALTLLCLSSLAGGLALIGHQQIVGLSGNTVPAGHALALVLVSWLVAAPSVLAFAAFGVLVSIATRNGLAGVIVPTVVGLALQLLLLVGGIGPVRQLLPNAGFVAWHGMWASPTFQQPIIKGTLAAVVYAAMCLAIGWRLFRRRDVTAA